MKRGPRSEEIKRRISEGKKRHNLWTGEELATLRRLYPSASREEILKAFPRISWDAIVVTANRRLGIYRRGKVPQRHKVGTFPRMSEEIAKVAAWAIALEGTITLHRQTHHTRGRTVCLYPMISMGNTDFEMLRQFRELTKYGRISEKAWRSNEKCKFERKWEIRSIYEMHSFLEQILPYLPSKRKQGDLLLRFLESRISRWKLPYIEEEFKIQERIKELNKKGPPKIEGEGKSL